MRQEKINWLPRRAEPEPDRRLAFEMELFADIELAEPYLWPSLDHLVANAFTAKRYSASSVVVRGTSHFGALEAYLSPR